MCCMLYHNVVLKRIHRLGVQIGIIPGTPVLIPVPVLMRVEFGQQKNGIIPGTGDIQPAL